MILEFFISQIHNQVGLLRIKLFLQLFEAQSTACGGGVGSCKKLPLDGAVDF